jgi:penicillin-binding protein 1A
MPLKMALAKSKNMVSIRILQAIGTQYAQDYATKFGFDAKQIPAYLTMALGAGNATPLQMAAAYAVFANGGYKVTPYLIQRIVDGRDNILAKTEPAVAGENAERAIDPRNSFVMTTLLRGVISIPGGTGGAARALGRGDLAGKTGTTNDNIDSWFCGFNYAQVGIAWIGFDQPRGLGANETGGSAALPIWIGYMGKALKGVPEKALRPPEGVIAVGGDYYFQEFPPRETAPMPLLPTQIPPGDAPSSLPTTTAAPLPVPAPAPMAPVILGTSATRPTPPPPPPAVSAPAVSTPPERSFSTPRSPFQPMDRAQ